MQIKRFEARNMSEALKMIKKEFGEEAVILSARNNRPGRSLLGRRKAKGVVVTAAIDHQAESSHGGRDQEVETTRAQAEDSGGSRNFANQDPAGKIIRQFKPITPTGQRIWQLRSNSTGRLASEDSISRQLYQKLVARAVEEKLAETWSRQSAKLMDPNLPPERQLHNALVQLLAAQGIVATMATSRRRKKAGLAIMVGPPGCGKTTMVAKLAVGHILAGTGSSAMITLDDKRAGGAYELEAYGRATGIPVLKAYDGRQLEQSLAQTEGIEHVYVDTAAMKTADSKAFARLRKMLAKLPSATILLTISSTAREDVVEKWMEAYGPLGIDGIVLTHLDESDRIGHIVNVLVRKRLPVAYLGDGPDIAGNVRPADAQAVARLLLPLQSGPENVGGREKDSGMEPSEQYVANRNSDIFHRHDCKAVRRINQDNMVLFNDQSDAFGQGFKPCRMCCPDLVGKLRFSRNMYAAGAR